MPGQSKALRQIAEDAPRYPAYKPLTIDSREIRVLDLGPNFRYTLRHVSLDDKPFYIALSYYWGAPGTAKSIWVNGFEIQLRKTVYQFLKSLFRQFRSITIWLDVICINQRDIKEQGFQVSMMGEIYSTANSVCSWLGVGNADTDYALRRLAGPVVTGVPTPKRIKKERKSSESIDGIVEGAGLREVLAGLEYIFLQPYWVRLWIIQEFVLNPALYIVCGSSTAAWDVLSGFMNGNSLSPSKDLAFDSGIPRAPVKLMRDAASETFRVFDEARQQFSTRDRALFELIVHFGAARCTDPLDRIFGLRSLAVDAHHVDVDYAANLFSLVVHLVSHRAQSLLELDGHRDSEVATTQDISTSPWNYPITDSEREISTPQDISSNDPQEPANILTLGRTLSYHLAPSRKELLNGLETVSSDWLTLDMEPCTLFEAERGFCAGLFRRSLVMEAGNDARLHEYAIDSRGHYCYRTVLSNDADSRLSLCVGMDTNGKCLDVGIALNQYSNQSSSSSLDSPRDHELWCLNKSERHNSRHGCQMASNLESDFSDEGAFISTYEPHPFDTLESKTAFRQVALAHIWPCRVRDAIHISRFFFALLLELDSLRRAAHVSAKSQLFADTPFLKLPNWLFEGGEQCRSGSTQCNCDKIISRDDLPPQAWSTVSSTERERRIWKDRSYRLNAAFLQGPRFS